jgi:hypothetical protein
MPNGSGLGVTIGMSEVTWRSARRTEVIVIALERGGDSLSDERKPISEGFERHFVTWMLKIMGHCQQRFGGFYICMLLLI